MTRTYNNKTDRDKPLSKNFKAREFMCKCGKYCTEMKLDDALVERLQSLRTALGKPIHINSGYRCPTHNRNVGGATRSRHVQGKAADIRADGLAAKELARCAEAMGFKGVILYPNKSFVHVDARAEKYLAVDDSNGKVSSVTTHGKPTVAMPGLPAAREEETVVQNGFHTVKKGETLTSIAKKYATTVNKLVTLNQIQDKNLIRVGQKIRVG